MNIELTRSELMTLKIALELRYKNGLKMNEISPGISAEILKPCGMLYFKLFKVSLLDIFGVKSHT